MLENTNSSLILITAPPASGKTYWISALREAFQGTRILVISPLRALADECKDKWQNSIDVMTPEEWWVKKTRSDIVIFDEFHLYYYWGDSFRPLMWEVFYDLSEASTFTFLLTATFSHPMQKELPSFKSQFDQIIWLDFGNQRLKFRPEMYIKAPNEKWIISLLEQENKGESVKLLFCQYREEVFKWEKKLSKLGHSVISCVGGQAQEMKEKLRCLPNPDFIVSTTVLSHGVNLPDIKRIYFLYPVDNRDFWIQMVARGGRRGESFEVYSLESPMGIKWNPVLNFLRVQWISFKMNYNFTRFIQDMEF